MHIIYEKQLAMFEALRRLGFTPDELFVSYNRGKPVTVLRAQGKELVLGYPDVALLTCGETAYRAQWAEACEFWCTTQDESDRQRIFETHILDAGVSVSLLLALHEHGFEWTKNSERTN